MTEHGGQEPNRVVALILVMTLVAIVLAVARVTTGVPSFLLGGVVPLLAAEPNTAPMTATSLRD